MRGFPSRIGLFEDTFALSRPFGRRFGVPSLRADWRGRRVVGQQNVPVHPKLPVHLGLEFLGRGVAGLQIGDQPTLHFPRIVDIGKEEVKPPHQAAVAGSEFTLNGDGQRLKVPPKGDGYLFVIEVFGADVVQEQDDAASLS